MKDENTYKKIYNISQKLLNNNLKYFAFLIIIQLCEDSIKNSKIDKIFRSSGYRDKFKNLVFLFSKLKNIDNYSSDESIKSENKSNPKPKIKRNTFLWTQW
jgi:hypothetical protein